MTAIEATGVVKSFDPVRGFGFVIIDGPEPREDALLHVSVLRAFNTTAVSPNQKVTCEITRGPKGLSVSRIIGLEDKPTDPTEFVQAQVKWYSAERGYGFVTIENDERDVFIHAEVVKASSLTDLPTGGYVLVKLQTGARGRRVTEIMSFEPGPVQSQ